MWLEDIFYGALASGVNKPTVVALNAALLGCILCLIVLIFVSIQTAPQLVIHVCFILALAVGLLILINWFLTQIGLVKVEDQKKQLFPLTDAQIEDDTDQIVQKGLRWAQLRQEIADSPELGAELNAQLNSVTESGLTDKKAD